MSKSVLPIFNVLIFLMLISVDKNYPKIGNEGKGLLQFLSMAFRSSGSQNVLLSTASASPENKTSAHIYMCVCVCVCVCVK